MSAQPVRSEVKLADLLPVGWTATEPKPKVWFTAFRMVNVEPSQLSEGPVTFDMLGIRVVLMYGTIPYYDTSGLRMVLTAERQVQIAGTGKLKDSAEGAWLLFFGLYEDSDRTRNESDLKTRISTAKGILTAILGRNVAYEQLCDNVVDLKNNTYSGFSAVFANPYVFPAPRLETVAYDMVRRVHDAIAGKSEGDRNRFLLSLHWFEMGVQEDGIDAYLRRWIALEIIAGCRSGELKPIKRLMGEAYSISTEKAAAEFHIGWLASIRANIVHYGRIRSMHYMIPVYLEAVYKDCLTAALGPILFT